MAGFFDKLRQGLAKTGGGMLAGIFAGDERIDGDFFDELEEALIVADVGMETTAGLIGQLREAISRDKLHTRSEARQALAAILAAAMKPETDFAPEGGSAALLIVGVNGVGKTTSLGKLAHYYKAAGRSPMLAAADTFRAAAAEQLTVWAERAGVPIVKQGEGADPAAVVFDAAREFLAGGYDLMIVDTAGRIHTNANLMSELDKIKRVVSREIDGRPVEAWLILDAALGQNALVQAREFRKCAGLSGLVLTKLDGTARGGAVLAIADEFNLPIRLIGTGEGAEDMEDFDPAAFVEALMS